MTEEQARRLTALINVQAEAEREYVRSKLRFTSHGRRDAWQGKLERARRAVREFVQQVVESA